MELSKLSNEANSLAISSNAALARCEHAMNVWGRSRSGMVLKNIVIAKERTPMRMMRQVGAELVKKKNAMIEAKYEVLKRRKKAEIKRAEAEAIINKRASDVFFQELLLSQYRGRISSEALAGDVSEVVKLENDARIEEMLRSIDSINNEPKMEELLLIEAEELETMAKMVEAPYVGAMREVMELTRLHDSIELQIRETHGKFDEEVFEIEEAKYWVIRAIDQSMRDMRQSGHILTGDQELLEQIGLDPSVIEVMIGNFLNAGVDSNDVSNARIEAFLHQCADKFFEASKEACKRVGLPVDYDTTHMMIESGE